MPKRHVDTLVKTGSKSRFEICLCCTPLQQGHILRSAAIELHYHEEERGIGKMEELEHQTLPEEPKQTEESIPEEPILVRGDFSEPPEKKQRADDVAMVQCMLCVLLVLSMFVLHWLRPEWQEMLLGQYALHRAAPAAAWLEELLRAVQQWMGK